MGLGNTSSGVESYLTYRKLCKIRAVRASARLTTNDGTTLASTATLTNLSNGTGTGTVKTGFGEVAEVQMIIEKPVLGLEYEIIEKEREYGSICLG